MIAKLIRLNHEYFYDVHNIIENNDTKRVRVLEVKNTDSCKMICLDTNRVFNGHPSWIQPDPKFLFKKYNKALDLWKNGDVSEPIYMINPTCPIFSRKPISPLVYVYAIEKDLAHFIDSFGYLDVVNVDHIPGLKNRTILIDIND